MPVWTPTLASGPCLGEVGAGSSGGVDGRLAGEEGVAASGGGGDVAGSGGGASWNDKR